MGDQDVAAAWPRPAGRGPVVALGKLVADQVLELCAPLVVGGQQRVVRTTTAGGAPANVTANLARLGVPARLAGWAGADPLTDGLLAALTGRGIETAVVRRGRAPLSTVLVHPDGERTLLTDRGEGGLEPADIRPAPPSSTSTVTTCCPAASPRRCGPPSPSYMTPVCRSASTRRQPPGSRATEWTGTPNCSPGCGRTSCSATQPRQRC